MNEIEQITNWLKDKEQSERKNAYYSGKQFDLGYASAMMDAYLYVKAITDKSHNT